MHQYFIWVVCAGDTNVDIISKKIVFKVLRLDEISEEVNVDKKKI